MNQSYGSGNGMPNNHYAHHHNHPKNMGFQQNDVIPMNDYRSILFYFIFQIDIHFKNHLF